MRPPVRCAIHQPNFFPRLATIEKLYASDIWVVLDNVQFARRDYQHRCLVAPFEAPEAYRWLSLPVHRPHGRASLINELAVIQPGAALSRAYRILRDCYRHSPHWARLNAELEALFGKLATTDSLTDIGVASSLWLLRSLGWQGSVRCSSELATRPGRSLRLAELCQCVDADEYLCGPGGARYLDQSVFVARGVRVQYARPAALVQLGLATPTRLSAVDAVLRVTDERLRSVLSHQR